MNVSYLKPGEFSKVKVEVPLIDILNKIKHDKPLQDKVLAVRNGKLNKNQIGGYTPSGSFNGSRKANNLTSHSGILAIDIDFKENTDIADKRDLLESDEYCFCCHQSVSGYGLVWYVKVTPSKHQDAFLAIEKYLANTYQVIADPACKDISRLRYLSWDPNLYLNESAKKWVKYLTKKQKESTITKRVPMAFGNDDLSYIMEQIGKGINIAEDYHDWLNVSFALASEYGDTGRAYFHEISRQSGKYESKAVDKQYDIALKRNKTGITIGTFFYLCKQAGITLRKEETIEAEMYFNQRVKSEPNTSRDAAVKSTIEYMKMKGVSPERTKDALKSIKDVPLQSLQTIKVNDKVLEIETFIKSHDIRFNLVTRHTELNGVQMDDRDYFEIYRKGLHVIGYELSKNKLFDLINSALVETYHPFTSFFEKNKHIKPSGRVQELLDCFDYQHPDIPTESLTQDEKDADYLEVFLTRWLIGIISSMHGTYSLLTLVLCGPQGCGKSKFFRELLPKELENYYAESKLENEKEGEMLMTKKILIVDDEFSGKNKRDANKFKEISSKEMFSLRRPYGRTFEDLPRYAVLGGTSNESEILYDTTGNRRIIPVNVNSIDHERLAAIDKTELFMELYWLWMDIGDKWFLTSNEIAYLNKSTLYNERVSFEEEMVLKWFEPSESEGGNTSLLTASEIKVAIDQRTGNRIYEGKLGSILKKLGFKQIRKRNEDGKTRRFYLCVDNYQKNSGNDILEDY